MEIVIEIEAIDHIAWVIVFTTIMWFVITWMRGWSFYIKDD